MFITIQTTFTDFFPRDGFALSTLYRKVQDLDCPILMVIQVLFPLRDKWKAVFPPNFYCFNSCQDVDQVIFGGLLSEPPKVTDSFCGKSNSVLKNLEFKIL